MPIVGEVSYSQVRRESVAVVVLTSPSGEVSYSPAHDEEYAKLKLRVVDEELFRVQENFPRLTQKSFADGIPSGVERVEYEINLAGFEHLRVTAKPEDFVFE